MPIQPTVPILCIVFLALLAADARSPLHAAVVDFEDVGSSLADNSFYNGGPNTNSDGWVSGGAQFHNSFTDFGTFTAWDGWAYSNIQDNVTAGFSNQYAAYSAAGTGAGYGAGNSRTYALAFPGSLKDNNGSVVNLPQATLMNSVDVTNTTYTLLAIRDGNDGGANFATQFQDGDYLRLIITGFDDVDATGSTTGSVEFDLANYGATGPQDDVLVTDWTTVDLSTLQLSRSLLFSLDSNVTDVFGNDEFLNPPSYLAVDNLATAVPEPSALAFVLLLTGTTCCRRRSRRR